VSDDEAEEPLPIDLGIPDRIPVPGGPSHVNLPVRGNPMNPVELHHTDHQARNPEGVSTEGPSFTADQWKDAMAKALGKEGASFKALQVQREMQLFTTQPLAQSISSVKSLKMNTFWTQLLCPITPTNYY